MADMTIADVRAKFPQYHDLSDDQLAQGLHQKFYSDMPFDQFASKIGYAPAQTVTRGPPTAAYPSPLADAATQVGNVVKGVPDALLSGASHLVSGVLAPPAALAARGVAALRGQDTNAASEAVHNWFDTQGTYHATTPGGRAAENDAATAGRAVAAPFAKAAGAIENAAGPQAAQTIEHGAGLANDVIGSVPVAGAAWQVARTAAAAPLSQVARGAADVAKEAGYTGLKSRADLKTPGAQAITDSLIAQDSGVVPGAAINVASVRNGRAVGPARVYNRMEASMPASLKQDPALVADLKGVGDTTSQLPRSPDVEALRTAMLNQPEMTSKELFSNIREARSRSAAALASEDPDKVALGKAYHQLANAYEDFAGRNIPVQSDISLPQWQDARTKFAKSFLAEEALKGGEHFDASVFGRAAQADPELLTGGGRVVADIHNALPTGSSEAVPRGVGAALGGVGGALAEHVAGGGFGMGGASGAVIGSQAAPAVRGAIRSVLTRGNPEAAAAAPTNPRLSYVYDASRPEAPAPGLDMTQGAGPYTPPLVRGPDGTLLPADRLSQEGGNGPVGVTPTQHELALPPGREPVKLGDQVRQQIKLRDEKAQQPGGGTTAQGPFPGGRNPEPVPFAGVQPREGVLPKRLGDFIRELYSRGR